MRAAELNWDTFLQFMDKSALRAATQSRQFGPTTKKPAGQGGVKFVV